jgi:hypothetical protein
MVINFEELDALLMTAEIDPGTLETIESNWKELLLYFTKSIKRLNYRLHEILITSISRKFIFMSILFFTIKKNRVIKIWCNDFVFLIKKHENNSIKYTR